jgi:hypothetical protein
MKEMNELESLLQTWTPRRPSPELEKRIFRMGDKPSPRQVRVEESPAPFAFRWLVPATAALLLICLVGNPRGSQNLSGTGQSGPMAAMILSNQSAMAYLPGSFKGDQNNIPADTFEWTNGSGSTSSIRSLSGLKGTN